MTPKARLIPLAEPFLSYLRADGIVLPSEDADLYADIETDSGIFSAPSTPSESDTEDDEPDPSLRWLEIHQKITATIAELGGSVVPKLNWSAPKDATWIAATNSMECRTPNDIYLLLKSSDFITHDLEQAFDGCESEESDPETYSHDHDGTPDRKTKPPTSPPEIPYHLILRKTIPSLITSLEFRCFVRARHLLCLCQRDLNHYSFLPSLLPTLRTLIQEFFDQKLKNTFPDDNFVFDVYVPQPQKEGGGRVWLIDINPWAPRTDPLLFSWLEILTMAAPEVVVGGGGGVATSDGLENGVLRLSLRGHGVVHTDTDTDTDTTTEEEKYNDDDDDDDDNDNDNNQPPTPSSEPTFRLVARDDPEAYSFNTPQYSAHKLPKDVVDAGADGEAGLREFMGRWRDIVAGQEGEGE